MAEEVIEQLPAVYPDINEPDNRFGYYWGGHASQQFDSDRDALISCAGLTGFSASVGSLNDTWLSSAGSGSGFSSGGGGGDAG